MILLLLLLLLLLHSAYSEPGLGVAPWPPAPPGDHLWQTLTLFRNPNVEPSSYLYTLTCLLISGYHQFVVANGTRRTDT